MTNQGKISLIAAIGTRTRGLGKNGQLLWRIPEDMQRFKTLTTRHPVIMGRKTWESIPEKFRPLPERTNIIITRDTGYTASGAIVAHSLEEALEKARAIEPKEIFIIGGAQIYAKSLPLADRLYLTLVDAEDEADAFFPNYSMFAKEISREKHLDSAPPYSYVVLEK